VGLGGEGSRVCPVCGCRVLEPWTAVAGVLRA